MNNILFDESSIKHTAVGIWKSNKIRIADAWQDNQFSKKLLIQWKIELPNIDRKKLKQIYTIPLFELLIRYLTTEEEKYLYLYLDERLRFAPHRLPKDKRLEFFDQLIDKDMQVLSELIYEHSDSIHKALMHLHSSLLKRKEYTLSVLAIGDCLMNEIRVFLPHLFLNESFDVDLRCIYFSAVLKKGISIDEVKDYLQHHSVDFLAISFFSFEGIASYKVLLKEYQSLTYKELFSRIDQLISMCDDFLLKIRDLTDTPIILHNISGLPLGRYRRRLAFLKPLSSRKSLLIEYLNHKISELVEMTSNCILLDEMTIAQQFGHRICSQPVSLSQHNKVMYHTSVFGNYISAAYRPILLAFHTFKKIKVICVDFDNTLWEGVMADGAVKQLRQRQQLLKELKKHGILLIAVSKNSEENIRWDEMILQKEDFALLKINWNQKVVSIREAASALNLNINSFYFIDDNPVELELVKSQQPDITCLDANDQQVWNDLNYLFSFPMTKDTEESRNRTSMYQAQASRNEILNRALDYPEMMKGLSLKAKIMRTQPNHLERVSELVSRTNQFNTTTIRYNKTELIDFLESENHVIYIAEFEDKFGKLGIVGIVILEIESTKVIFNSFILSCRAMGFSLEDKMIYFIIQQYPGKDFIGRYIKTDRNSPCENLYSRIGFIKVSDTDWKLTCDKAAECSDIDWISLA